MEKNNNLVNENKVPTTSELTVEQLENAISHHKKCLEALQLAYGVIFENFKILEKELLDKQPEEEEVEIIRN